MLVISVYFMVSGLWWLLVGGGVDCGLLMVSVDGGWVMAA